MKPLLTYDFPKDLKEMSQEELEMLALSIREFLIDQVSKTGGHLASNLGVVELSIALHRVFDSPRDKIVWDVGHQSYVHKILTGRAEQFDRLRKLDGLSGFPRREESEHDAFDTGHSSTSVSLVCGMAVARDMAKEDYETIAVIGDGSLTGGLAYEGLNNLGDTKSKAIVIVNDNGMSIGKNTGSVSSHLGKLRVSEGYYKFKRNVGKTLDKIPGIGTGIHAGMEKIRDTMKYALVDGVLFEELGFTYLGPIDGHSIGDLMENMELAKAADGPVVLHVITQKGRGYRNAEQNPDRFHGTGPFDPETGRGIGTSNAITCSARFASKLSDMARDDSRIVAISAAMIDGTGLTGFQEEFPDRIFDVGIAEAHAVSFAAGLASAGKRPVVAIYSAFLQRAFDPIMTDVGLAHLPVLFAIDRAGIVGADGQTHHGIYDLSYMNQIPGMTVMAPRDEKDLEGMMEYAMTQDGPVSIRYPRGTLPGCGETHTPISEGAQVILTGEDLQIWAIGNMVKTACDMVPLLREKGIHAGVTDARFIKPLDEEVLKEDAARVKWIVTLEDNTLRGGFGQQISMALDGERGPLLLHFGWPDEPIPQGTCQELMERYGLTAEGMAEKIGEFLEKTT